MPDHYSDMSRRRFLVASAATAGLTYPALMTHARQADFPPLDQYKPEYFTPLEWEFVLAATARLIPASGEGPGALETQVPLFIDKQLAGDYGQAAD